MAKIEFQIRDPAARYGYSTLGRQEFPEVDDAAEAVAALARLLGVSVPKGEPTDIDRDRYHRVNPSGRLCRIVVDLR